VLAAGNEIGLQDLSESIREERLVVPESQVKSGTSDERSLKDRVTTLEIQMIRDAMAQTNGDRRRAAKILGLSHQGLLNKLKRYGLEK
jgi:DNA-binding NtrC family response regulator